MIIISHQERIMKIADEIAAIQERLKVLRMSTAEFQELKSKEIQKVISNAQIEEDLAQKKKKQYEEELKALKKLEEEMSAYVFMIRVDANGKNAYVKVLNGSFNIRDIITTNEDKTEKIKNIMI